MAAYNPGSVRVRQLQIAGVTYDPISLKELSITESLMRSFQTLEMMVIDSRNLLNNFLGNGIEGGEDVYLVFEVANSGEIYEARLKVHSVSDQIPLPNSPESQVYKVTAVGFTYFGNKVGGKVQQSFRNVIGSEAIKTIHNEYLRATDAPFIVDPSKGYLGEREPYVISNETPFQAIHKIRTRLTSDEYNTGAFCYYRDRTGYKLKQLEKMFAELVVREVVVQTATLGTSLSDYREIGRRLIKYESGTSFSGPGGFASPLNAFSTDGRVHTNYFNFGEGYNRGNQEAPAPGSLSGRTRLNNQPRDVSFPRQYNIFPGDPRLNIIDTIQEKNSREVHYISTILAGPSFTGQVMIDSGVRMTVGEGIFANLLPPQGGTRTNDNALKGEYLVVNLKHTLRLYDISPMGLTTFEAIRGGYNT
jgi:hypothetical protein